MKNLRLLLFFFVAINIIIVVASYRKNYADSVYIYFDWGNLSTLLKEEYQIDIHHLKEEITNSLDAETIQDSIIYPVFQRHNWKFKHSRFLERRLDHPVKYEIDSNYIKLNDKKACFITTRHILKSLYDNHLENHPNNRLPPEFFECNLDYFFILDGVYCPPRYSYFIEELIYSSGIKQEEVIYLLVLEFVLKRINDNFILKAS